MIIVMRVNKEDNELENLYADMDNLNPITVKGVADAVFFRDNAFEEMALKAEWVDNNTRELTKEMQDDIKQAIKGIKNE